MNVGYVTLFELSSEALLEQVTSVSVCSDDTREGGVVIQRPEDGLKVNKTVLKLNTVPTE